VLEAPSANAALGAARAFHRYARFGIIVTVIDLQPSQRAARYKWTPNTANSDNRREARLGMITNAPKMKAVAATTSQ
jgi:hypothetical protein